MKVCFLLDEICAGSSSVIAGEMARGLKKRGIDLTIVAIVRRELDDKMKENLGEAKIRYVEDSSPCWYRRLDLDSGGFRFSPSTILCMCHWREKCSKITTSLYRRATIRLFFHDLKKNPICLCFGQKPKIRRGKNTRQKVDNTLCQAT